MGLSGWEKVIHRPRTSPAVEGELGLLLNFEPRLEAEYARELQVRSRKNGLRATCVALVVMVGEFFLSQGYALISDSDAAARFSAFGRVVGIASIMLGWAVGYWDMVNAEFLALVISTLLSIVFFTTNTYRTTVAFGTQYWYRYYGTCEAAVCNSDATLLLCLACVVIGSLTFVAMRVSRSWSLIVITAGAYAGMSSGDLGPMPASEHLQLTFLYLVLCLFNWCGCYAKEWETRRRWYDNRCLRMQVEAQKAAYEHQQQFLEEMEERLDAMRVMEVAASGPKGGQEREETFEQTLTQRSQQAPIPSRWADDDDTNACSSGAPLAVEGDAPNRTLVQALAGRKADEVRSRKIVERIRDPQYGMKEFFSDAVAAYPELDLFFIGDGTRRGNSSSGLTAHQEYQRTIGALFAVYWMMRLDVDGKRGFCFGCDENWEIPYAPIDGDEEKRVDFFENMQWTDMEQVTSLAIGSSLERLEAMLCLTAFHDIMKMPNLCPTVARKHAPYQGYDAGTVINDHDIALAYVLEYYPDVLPSFRMLPPTSREVVLFTQSKMQFNHGWFVQGEAPPGTMLKQFKGVLQRSRPGDVAFYFFHWLTDLSGAEGTPLGGAEKFVLKFPRPVLSVFLWSIPFLQDLRNDSETAVVEKYLEARFRTAIPDVPLPEGDSAIAQLRLVAMAQSRSDLVMEAWENLPKAARRTLANEMARTGARGQLFESSPVCGGPAFVIYYGPALLQRCHTLEEMIQALFVLAGVYKAGRKLWPVDLRRTDESVTLEVSQLKTMNIHCAAGKASEGQIPRARQVWVLVLRNSREAVVELVSASQINDMMDAGTSFWGIDWVMDRELDKESEASSFQDEISV